MVTSPEHHGLDATQQAAHDPATEHVGVLTDDDLLVLGAATRAAHDLKQRQGKDDFTHTVASSAIDSSDRVHTAVNVHHFTGGPCAELALLGAAAATTADRIEVIVAVASSDLRVLPPCGRCRQVLLDLHPNAHAIVEDAQGLTRVPVARLLPHAYRQAAT